MAISTEINKLIHNTLPEEMQEGLIEEFNNHLLSFHEEMEIILEKASEKYKI